MWTHGTDTVILFPQRCFTLMDRGFTFKLINNYVNNITASDNKVASVPGQQQWRMNQNVLIGSRTPSLLSGIESECSGTFRESLIKNCHVFY